MTVSEQVPRTLGGLSSYTIVAGSMLGVGIFLAPPIVAQHLHQPSWFFAMWLIGGVVALAGAVSFAELGAMMPRSGGDYVIQAEALGPSVAFASGWVLFGAIFAGSIAMLCSALCEFQFPVLFGISFSRALLTVGGWSLTLAHVVAMGLIVTFTGINALGSRLTGIAQTLLTLTPVAIFAIASVGMFFVDGTVDPAPIGELPTLRLGGLLIAFDAVYFAYSGWPNIVYVAGEVKSPARNIPRALVGGTVSIAALYLIICMALMHVLGMNALAGAGEAGSAAAAELAGDQGRWLFTLVVAVALLAGVNATVLSGARILYAMGMGGAAGSAPRKISPRRHVPARALWLQAAWSGVLLLTGGFVQLLEMASIAMLITGSLTVISLFVLRAKNSDRQRPYRATGYPWLPGCYLLASITVLFFTASTSLTRQTGGTLPLLGIIIFVLAFFVHRTWRTRHSS